MPLVRLTDESTLYVRGMNWLNRSPLSGMQSI